MDSTQSFQLWYKACALCGKLKAHYENYLNELDDQRQFLIKNTQQLKEKLSKDQKLKKEYEQMILQYEKEKAALNESQKPKKGKESKKESKKDSKK